LPLEVVDIFKDIPNEAMMDLGPPIKHETGSLRSMVFQDFLDTCCHLLVHLFQLLPVELFTPHSEFLSCLTDEPENKINDYFEKK
jgi:hypothetical protein